MTRPFVRPPASLAGAAAFLLLLLWGACSDSGTGPSEPTRIAIAPDGDASLWIGDTLRVHATITGTQHNRVTYRSSAPEIAEVDPENGLVTARSAGTAAISGVSAIDPRIFAELHLTVLDDPAAAVEFQAIATEGGAALPIDEVEGAVVARMRLLPGNARRFEARLRDDTVCSAELSPPAPGSVAEERTVECAFDTGGFDESTGEVRFPNGPALLEAVLVASGDRQVAVMPRVTIGLRNRPRIAGRIIAERTASDGEGAEWLGGDLTLRAVPVLYDGGEVEGVSMAVDRPSVPDTSATTSGSPPFEFILPAEGVLAGVTDPAFEVELTSTTVSGDAGPTGRSQRIRYDAAPPEPGSMRAREWVGEATRFIDLYSREGERDEGVGKVRASFIAGDPRGTRAEIAANGTPVERGGDLEQAGAGSYRLVARVCDALENCVLADGFDFGVDLTPPILEGIDLPDRSVNPQGEAIASLRDDLSGFGDRPLEVAVRRLSGGTDAACGPTVDGIDLPGQTAGGTCAPDTVPIQLDLPHTAPGYYQYSLTALDRAGNRSAGLERMLLVDHSAPSIPRIDFTTPVTPGEAAGFRIEATDDVDLHLVELRFVYPAADGPVAIPFTGTRLIGTPFELPLIATAQVDEEVPFVRTLTVPVEGQRSTHLVDSIRATARDAAGHPVHRSVRLSPEEYGGDTSVTDPFPRYSSSQATLDRTAVCTAACGAGDPGSVRVTVRIEGESGTGRPFARLHLLLRNASGALIHAADIAGSEASIVNVGNRSSYEYSLNLTPQVGLTGEFTVVAVGVNSRGNALTTDLEAGPALSLYAR